jgi:aspartate/methionine/tyrosine aminotransferase
MGASLAGLRAVGVPAGGRAALESISPKDRDRALLLWVNSPSNPTGMLSELPAYATWGREHGILVVSDECYADYIWNDEGWPHTILDASDGIGSSDGILAVHSLSKRSNFAGARAGFYAGDPSVVAFLVELRKHAGLMVPGPIQSAAIAALADDDHVARQREVYHSRLVRLVNILAALDVPATLPQGSFYLWVSVPSSIGDCWDMAEWLAERLGIVASPGEFYGAGGKGHVRIAAVVSGEHLDIIEKRAAN